MDFKEFVRRFEELDGKISNFDESLYQVDDLYGVVKVSTSDGKRVEDGINNCYNCVQVNVTGKLKVRASSIGIDIRVEGPSGERIAGFDFGSPENREGIYRIDRQHDGLQHSQEEINCYFITSNGRGESLEIQISSEDNK